jgi:hypothetical protein
MPAIHHDRIHPKVGFEANAVVTLAALIGWT